MHLPRLLHLTLTLVFCSSLSAQKESNIWIFGQDAGIHFNAESCEPRVISSVQNEGFEGSSAICNPRTGSLLFYFNGVQVYSRNMTAMENGELFGSSFNSVTQNLILPKPGSNDIYYLFTSELQASNFNTGLQYHMVDLTENNGLGKVVEKNKPLAASYYSEKIIGIPHGNGQDYWILTHKMGSNDFHAFLLTSKGIEPQPVISSVGKVHIYDMSHSNWDAVGEMKSSADYSKIAVVTHYQPDIEIFNFNQATGKLSNPITIPEKGQQNRVSSLKSSNLYGVNFSPNGRFLYVTHTGNFCELLQFDLISGSANGIAASRQVLFQSDTSSVYGLKQGPDGKIYVGGHFRDYLGVIQSPNLGGSNASYSHNGFYLGGGKSGWGLHNGIELNTYCSPVSMSAQGPSSDITCYPNPARVGETIFISVDEDASATVAFYDLQGRLITTQETKNQRLRMPEYLAAGTYQLRIQVNQTGYRKLLVVQ